MMRQERRIAVPETLSRRSVAALLQAIEAATSDTSVNAIVVHGTGDSFCRGLDFEDLAHVSAGQGGPSEHMERYCQCLKLLRFADKPTIAVVQAAAIGGGMGLVAACDVVIASESATFALPEALFGFAPAMVLPFLLERVPMKTARLWAISAATRNALEAAQAGLVDTVVSEDQLDVELRRCLKQFRRVMPRGVGVVKRLCAEVPSLDVSAGVELGRASTLAALEDADITRGIAQFKSEGILPWEAT